ncbi:MAG TPA: metallopeptidase TldD-related protein [Candidatus Aquilonibacter sp.]|nr:metallopeptidase TldD-related protein [Candidatus Aquilonibacter sp.]
MRPAMLLLAAAILAPSAVAQHHAATTAKSAAAESDPLLNAMKAELTREQQLLVLPGMERPYFIQYRLEDVHTYEALADYGALVREVENHQRAVRVEVRVGNYTTDSSTTRGLGSVEFAATDNDPDALRMALWTATDAAYKSALQSLTAKQAALKQFQNPPTANDFSPAKAVTRIEPLVALDIDRDDWKHRVIEASGLYAVDPAVKAFASDVQFSSARVIAMAVNRYTVNTDGTMLRHGYATYQDLITIGGQAPDGMQIARDNGTTATAATGLESWPTMRKRTIDDLLSYNDLRQAPLVAAEDYHGPVLFSGDSAADVFNRLFVPNIEADRPEMGTIARTTGAYASSLHSAVLPNYLSVVDDPTMRTFEGQSLFGSYAVDDEGVPVAPVTLVKDGELVNYDIGREPVKDFPASNGHGRAALVQGARSRAGVIVVKSSQNLTAEQMRAKLVAMAKEKGEDVYEVETMGGELMPRVLYRVSPDGKRTLVRGAAFDDLDQRALRADIIAAGGKPWVAQVSSPVPETTIVPEILFDDITVKRANEEQQKVPYYPPPAAN